MKTLIPTAMLALTAVSGVVVTAQPAAAFNPGPQVHVPATIQHIAPAPHLAVQAHVPATIQHIAPAPHLAAGVSQHVSQHLSTNVPRHSVAEPVERTHRVTPIHHGSIKSAPVTENKGRRHGPPKEGNDPADPQGDNPTTMPDGGGVVDGTPGEVAESLGGGVVVDSFRIPTRQN